MIQRELAAIEQHPQHVAVRLAGFLRLVDEREQPLLLFGRRLPGDRAEVQLADDLLRRAARPHRLFQQLGPAIRQNPSRWPAIAVFPQVPPDSQWVGTPADVAVAALQQTMREFHVDPTRVYLTGLSMGGHGTWYVAYRHPELFAAIVPICGWVRDFPQFRGSAPVVPGDSESVMPTLVQRLGKVPIWIFHGEVDQVVNVNGSREPAAALKAAGADVHYSELLGLNHNSWDAAYASEEFRNWLFAQQRR